MRKLIFIVALFVTVLSFTFLSVSTAKAEGNNNVIKVNLNGSDLKFDADPYIKDGRTLVPFRRILESFGATVQWNDEDKSIVTSTKTVSIQLRIADDTAYVNWVPVKLDIAPEIKDGRTFVPLRFISENLGAQVSWEENTRTILINYDNNTYKIGQMVLGKDLKYVIDAIDINSPSLSIRGRINSKDVRVVAVLSDEINDTMTTDLSIFNNEGSMYSFGTDIQLITCHGTNFDAKYLTLKLMLDEEKFIKLGEYKL